MAAFGQSAQAAPDAASYPMTCMLGPTNQTGFGTGEVVILFQPSSKPAAEGLQPGQCAFEDRGVRASEPNQLKFSGTLQVIVFRNGGTAKSDIQFGGPAANILPAIVFGPTRLVNMFVHAGVNSVGFPAFVVDKFGV